MCQQQQQVESVAVERAPTAEELLQRKLDNMKNSGMPEKAIKTVEKMLKRRQQKVAVKSENDVFPSDLIKVNKYEEDVLALSTRYTKIVLEYLSAYAEEFQESKIFAILTRTTQPAHLILIAIVMFVLWSTWPLDKDEHSYFTENKGLTVIGYLGSFAINFGAQIWMTFVSGLALYFALPRHTFGQCQQILFPKYFAMNAGLSIATLILFAKLNKASEWHTQQYIQATALSVCSLVNLGVRLYLVPPLLRLMHMKYKFENAAGSGEEIGHLNQKDLIQCPRYQMIHKRFRRIHMSVAICNMIVLVCTIIHLHYLAHRISIS